MYIHDIIIIGAGISGMVAAHTILEKTPTLDILILEAKDRIGGRTLSIPVEAKHNTCLFDFGAHWVSSSQKFIIKYINLLNLTLVPQQNGIAIGVNTKDTKFTFQDNPIIGNIFTVYEIKEFFAWLEQKSEMYHFNTIHNKFVADFYDCMTMESYINHKMYTSPAKNVVRNIIRSTTGADPSQISVMFYLLLCNSSLGFTNQYMNSDGGAREYWIKEGAQEICNRLLTKIGNEYILLNEPVIEINSESSDYVIIKTAPGNIFYTSYVICAIPPDQILHIRFQPVLSRHKRFVLESTQAGHLTRFIITYHKAFWLHDGYSGEIFSCEDGPILICHDATKNDNPALIGYIQEPLNISPDLQGTYKNSVISQLVKYWGIDAEDYIDYKEYSWWDELYNGGCPMTCSGIGSIKWYNSLTKSLGRIHWAGAETATEWNGYMNGAIQAGYRAAINTLYDSRPQCLNYRDITFIEIQQPHKIRLQQFSLINKYTISATILGAGYLVYLLYVKHILLK